MIKQRERILDSKVFSVDQVILENGAVRQVVMHGGSVVLLPLMDDGRLVLIQNERWAVGETLWELCAGTLEEGEVPAECAARELIEETGYEAANLQPLTQMFTCPGFCTEFLHCFLATGLKQVGQNLDETEQIEVELVEPNRALEMIRTGEIRDAKTIATILHWHLFIREGKQTNG